MQQLLTSDFSLITDFSPRPPDGSNLPLVFAPEQGNMLGGNLVNISGPCFGPNTLVKCRFYDREVEGVVRDTNTAFCVQPRLFATGYIDVAVSLDGGPYYWKGQYYVGQ